MSREEKCTSEQSVPSELLTTAVPKKIATDSLNNCVNNNYQQLPIDTSETDQREYLVSVFLLLQVMELTCTNRYWVLQNLIFHF